MVFSSFTFLFAFLPITLLIYFVVPKKMINIKNIVLLVMSLIFYALGELKYFWVMIISILVNYFVAIKMNDKNKKILLVLSIVFNIGMLGVFKYANFFIGIVNHIPEINIKALNITLPIGISFFTFQIMSYVIDVYWGKVKAQKNIISVATYITLFPQLIAGPIVNYKTVENELSAREQRWENVASGFRRFIIGLAKKVIIANNVAVLADAVFNSPVNELGTILVWVGAIAYAIQIYFDFSGYSDMAIGLGKIFGFKFLENFNYPYIAESITDFWRRWHISLSSWFKEYVYIPLGGNRCSRFKWLRNIFIVWMLTGFWHGANWNFIIWGLYFAVFLIIEKVFLSKYLDKIPKVFRHIYALIIILIGWIIFRVEDIQSLGEILKMLFVFKHSEMAKFIGNNGDILGVWPFMILGIIGGMPWIKKLGSIIIEKSKSIGETLRDIVLVGTFGITILFLLSLSYNPFIYFRF